uniref:Uncharacterized protein n=1 Tax=Spongospora subterranea TaxID=70186 RepID=A0A0H5RDR4_9EUKA|eukprot:CRZ06689.1 hypothetical protein [Spongospora subterranea]
MMDIADGLSSFSSSWFRRRFLCGLLLLDLHTCNICPDSSTDLGDTQRTVYSLRTKRIKIGATSLQRQFGELIQSDSNIIEDISAGGGLLKFNAFRILYMNCSGRSVLIATVKGSRSGGNPFSSNCIIGVFCQLHRLGSVSSKIIGPHHAFKRNMSLTEASRPSST